MANLLLKSGCSPNAQNNELETSVFAAIACGNYKFARFLLTKKEANCKITAQQTPNGKTLLSLMADKCTDIDVCFVIFGDGLDNENNLAITYAKEFETMARIKDENGLTPFQIACSKLNELLAQHPEKVPDTLTRFITFLYKNCKSNPNEEITESATSSNKNKFDADDVENSEGYFFLIVYLFIY